MGVLKLNNDENIMTVLDNKSGAVDNVNEQPDTEAQKTRKKHWIVHDRATPTSKRKQGVRSARRSENLSCLLALLDGQDDNCEHDLLDVVEPSNSAFSELFNQQEKMKIWNDFVNSTEEEQERILAARWCDVTGCDVTEDKWEEEAMEKEGFTVIHNDNVDKRQVHPSFSAAECFKQIDTSLRSLIKKRHLPLGVLNHLEEEIVGFFMEWSTPIYIAKLESSYQRLLMHAVCQYLSLSSRSFDDDHGQRQTQVENKQSKFYSPDISLTNYLSQLH